MRHRNIHKIEALVALATASLLAAAVCWSYVAELKGPYVDAIASDLATKQAGLPVTVLDVRVRRWRDIRFGLATVVSRDGRTLMACGQGHIVLRDLAFLKGESLRAHVSLRDVALLEDLYRHWSMTSWAAGKAFKDPIFVRTVESSFVQGEKFSELHLLSFDSDEMVLAGGVRWSGRRFLKANIFVLLPEEKFEDVPKELRARMIRRPSGWKGFRVTYGAGCLTVYGASGPFFRAQWASAG